LDAYNNKVCGHIPIRSGENARLSSMVFNLELAAAAAVVVIVVVSFQY
jgi:hypothetical protein